MATLLPDRIQKLRLRIRQALWLYGLSAVVLVLFCTTLFSAVLDWLIHIDDPGTRLILSLGIVLSTVGVGWKFLAVPLLQSLSNLDMAMRIEQRFPLLKDRLASSVQFLDANCDPRFGSLQLQQRVINETMSELAGIDTSDVVETGPVRRLAMFAVIICVTTAVIVGLNQENAVVAVSRLALPFSETTWPRQTELHLLFPDFSPFQHDPTDPLRVARGETLKFFVENSKGKLPENVFVQYRFDDDKIFSEKLRQTTLRDEEGRVHEVAVVTLLARKGPIRFRVIGGDDGDMPEYELLVVPPPVIEELQITLTPPVYTRRKPEQTTKGVGHIQGLVGTRVEIEARINKPLQSANVRIKDRLVQHIDLSKAADGFQTAFTISEPGIYSYWFDLKDRQGFENPEAPRFEIRGIEDRVPDIYIDKPAGDLTATVNAVVPLRVVARDDIGLDKVYVLYRLGGTEDASGISIGLPINQSNSEQLTVDHNWNLSETALVPGMRVEFHAEATDDFDLGPEHIGRSISRTLTIITAEEKTAELAARQADILNELERVQKLQSTAYDRVGELLVQLENVGTLQSRDIDLLKRTELDQRQIASHLFNPVDGIAVRTQAARRDIENNRLDNPEMKKRLDEIARELSLIQEKHLPIIEQELTQARKTAFEAGHDISSGSSSSELDDENSRPNDRRNSSEPGLRQPEDGGEQITSLAKAKDSQIAVIESLDQILQKLNQWRSQRDLGSELNGLISGQEELNRQTSETGTRTLTKSPSELSSQDRADLARIAARQNRQADHADRLQKELRDAIDTLLKSTPDAADTFLDALDQLTQQAIANRMRDVSQQLQKNRIGQAASEQNRIVEQLRELRTVLQNRGISDTEALVRKLKQAEQELEVLRKKQRDLSRDVDELRKQGDPENRENELQRLKKKQQKLGDETARLARQLRRLRANRTEETVERARTRMREAENRLADEDAENSLDEQNEALDDLMQAQRELAHRRQQAEEQLAKELLEQISDQFAGLIAQQQNVIEETIRLDAEHAKRGNWSRGQLKSLRNLTETQRHLQQKTERHAKTLQPVEVIAFALEGAVRQMSRAADRLEKRRTDEKTISAETAAYQRLLAVVSALKPDQGGASPSGASGNNSADQANADGIPQLAQLKMLRSLQNDIKQRTSELDDFRQTNGKLSPEEQLELDALKVEQGTLADLVRNLTQKTDEAFEMEELEDE